MPRDNPYYRAVYWSFVGYVAGAIFAAKGFLIVAAITIITAIIGT
jgi:hypothetical protein